MNGELTELLHLPPLHPLFVNFTAALLPASVISDLLGRSLARPSLLAAGRWMMLFAALVTPLTAATGWYWWWEMEHHQPEMLIHMWLGTALAVLLAPLAVWRWRTDNPRLSAPSPRREGEERVPGRAYLLVAVVMFLGMFIQGHVGAKMSFGFGHDHHATDHDAGSNRHQWQEYIDLTEIEP